MSKFIPVSAFRDVELSTVDYKNRAIQLPGRYNKLTTCVKHPHNNYYTDARLQIGLITQQKVKSLLDDGDVSPVQVSRFFDGARCFYEKAMEYGLKSLPFNDPLLKAATFINFEQRANADPLHAEFFVNR